MSAASAFAAITPASVNKNLIMFVRPDEGNAALTSAGVNRNLIMFVRPDLRPAALAPEGVNKNLIMFVSPDESAAANLAAAITPKMIHDIYESLPAGAVTETVVTTAMDDVKTYLLTGQGLSTSLIALAGVITTSTAPPSSAAAGKQLARLITGSVIKDIITLVAPTVSGAEVKSSIDLLKTDLKTGLGIEPWLKTMESTFGLLPTAAHAA